MAFPLGRRLMGSRFVTVVAFYGPKADPLRRFLTGVRETIAEQLGGAFRPYSLEQIHATVILLNAVRSPRTAAVVNERYLESAGLEREMDLARAMRILTAHLARPLPVRIGGFRPGQQIPFRSQGRHPHERSFSLGKDNAFVLVGWPAAALAGAQRPLDALRRDMNAANVLHRYHRHDGGVDDDFHLVLGHHTGAPEESLKRAVATVRDRLASAPIELAVGLDQVKVVAADSHTLAPARFVGGVPVDEATLRGLMT